MYSLSFKYDELKPYLTINQFEDFYTHNLKNWLVTEGFCPLEEAENLGLCIILNLKSDFSLKKSYHFSLIWEAIAAIAKRESDKIKKQMEKNFDLTESAFQKLTLQLQAGDDRLFEQIFLSHYKDCIYYLIRNYSASYEDAYDATMETLLNFHKGLKNNKIHYGNLRFLFTKMAGQIYIKWIKRQNLKDPIKEMDLVEDPQVFNQEVFELLDKAWEGLCKDCKQLLKKFYYENISLKEIAYQLNKSPEAIRKRKQRCVEKLKNYFLRIS